MLNYFLNHLPGHAEMPPLRRPPQDRIASKLIKSFGIRRRWNACSRAGAFAAYEAVGLALVQQRVLEKTAQRLDVVLGDCRAEASPRYSVSYHASSYLSTRATRS